MSSIRFVKGRYYQARIGGTNKPGSYVGTFMTREEAERAIAERLAKSMEHIGKRACVDCGVVFFFRRTPGSGTRKRCKACNSALEARQFADHICATGG